MKVFDWQKKIDQKELEECKKVVQKGGIIIFPTDTVYGIGCDCFNQKALEKIYSIKRRNLNKPVNVLCSDINAIKSITKNLSMLEKKIIDKYMPGDLTIILSKKENVKNDLINNVDTVGVRIPKNDIALTLLNYIKIPLTTTSANISDEAALTNFKDVYEKFKNNDDVDIIINGGQSDIGIASTIIRIENNQIVVLRHGNLKVTI
jgi:L-threonylcarbamoyladenylate synthase